MAKGKPVGKMYVEMDLDSTKYTKAQKAILKGAEKNSADVNKVMKTVGTQSDQMYNAMRKNIENALNAIKKSHKSSADEIRRAQEGAAKKIKRINELQFGHQKSLIEQAKKHWLSLAAGAYAAMKTIKSAWSMMESAADFRERINSLDALGKQYGMTGRYIVESMKDASRGILSLKEASDLAASAMNLNLTATQMIEFTRVAESLTDVIGGSIPDAYNRLVVAAASGRTMTLAQMGIIVDLKAAYKAYGGELTESAKQQIRLNTILEAAKEKTAALGETIDTERDKMDRFSASIADIKLQIGELTLSFTPLLEEISNAIKGFNIFFGIGKRNEIEKEIRDIYHELKSVENITPIEKASNWLNKVIFGHDDPEIARQQRISDLEASLADAKKRLWEFDNHITTNKKNVEEKKQEIEEQYWEITISDTEDAIEEKIQIEEEYADEVYNILDDIVNAEADAANDRVKITHDMALAKAKAESSSGLPGTPTGQSVSVTRYYYTDALGNRQYTTYQDWQRRQTEELERISSYTYALTNYAADAERRDMDRLAQERLRAAQAFWGSQANAASGLFGQATTISDFISALQLGTTTAPVMSQGGYGLRYQELLTGAMGSEDRLQELMSFLPQYLAMEKAYGGPYGNVFSSIISDLEALQLHYETMGWLADLGIGDTAEDINLLIEAFNALGMSTEDLRAAAETAAGIKGIYGLGLGLTDTKLPFQNVIDALGTMTGTTETKLIAIGDMWQAMVTGIGGSMDSISGAISDIYQTAQANPTITYQPTVVHGAWSMMTDAFGNTLWWGKYPGQQDIGPIYSPTAPQNPPEWVIYGPPGEKGGLWEGNKGGEWFVPTYEPERGKFLKDVGVDPAEIARQIQVNGGGEVHVSVQIDGREIGNAVARQMKSNTDLQNSVRRLH